jgi:hypothetical protein
MTLPNLKHNIVQLNRILILIMLALSSFNHAQKQKLIDSIPNWDRFEKGNHGLTFFLTPTFASLNESAFKINRVQFSPNLELGYFIVPFENLILKSHGYYSYSFGSLTPDHQVLGANIQISYLFFGKNRFFLSPEIGLTWANFRYRIETEYPQFKYFNDSEPNNLYVHNIYRSTIGACVGWYFGKKMSISLTPTFYFPLQKTEGKYPFYSSSVNIRLTYTFKNKLF